LIRSVGHCSRAKSPKPNRPRRRRKCRIKPHPSKPNGDPSLPTVFVIDDDAALRATMRELLALDGRSVETYSSCELSCEPIPSRKGCLIVDARCKAWAGSRCWNDSRAEANSCRPS
jgi:hypothetical protein